MENTIDDLKNIIKANIEDIVKDPDLCSSYPLICKFVTSETYLQKIIDSTVLIVKDEEVSNILAALAIVEDNLNGDQNL
jgi:hypothetical protein